MSDDQPNGDDRTRTDAPAVHRLPFRSWHPRKHCPEVPSRRTLPPQRLHPLACASLPSSFVCCWSPPSGYRCNCGDLEAMPFHTKGEPREALMVQSIVRDHHWILPRRNAVELPAKPPLFHWLGAAVSFVRGHIDEGTVRLPSAVCSLIAAVIVLATGFVAVGCGGRSDGHTDAADQLRMVAGRNQRARRHDLDARSHCGVLRPAHSPYERRTPARARACGSAAYGRC